MPITVLSAEPKYGECLKKKRKKQRTPPMKNFDVQQSLDRRYGAQTDLIGFFYLLYVVIGRTFHRLQLLLHLKCFAGLDISLLFKNLDRLRQLTFFLSSLGQGFFYLLEFCQQSLSLFADKSEILCFNTSLEDFKMPMFLCFSSTRSFTFTISLESWA